MPSPITIHSGVSSPSSMAKKPLMVMARIYMKPKQNAGISSKNAYWNMLQVVSTAVSRKMLCCECLS